MKKRIIAIVLMTVFSLSALFSFADLPKKTVKVREDYVPVEVEKVRLHTLSEKIDLSGQVIAENKVSVVPKVIGEVKSVSVTVGDKVNKGSVLFTLDDSELQGQVNQAKNALDMAQASYNNLKKQLGNSKSQELDSLRLQVDQAEQAYKTSQNTLKGLTVESPIEGVVTEVDIREGEVATNTKPSVVVIDESKVHVRVDISENLLEKIAVGDEAVIELAASDRSVEGVVDIVSPSIDERTQLYFIDITLTDETESLRPGMFVRVNVETVPKGDVLAVETDSILNEGGESHVFVETEGRAIKREIVEGIESGDYTEVISGISISENLIIKGQEFVRDNTRVRVVRGDEE